MPLDIDRLIRSTDRSVTSGERDGAPARSVVITRTFGASREDLWEAITSGERIPRWFLPVTGDLRLGGRYQLEGNAGGTILECDAPVRLAITWEWQDNVSWVMVDLTEDPAGGTRLRLAHEEIVGEPDEFWQQYGPGGGGVGWDLALMGLDQHVASGERITPENAIEWMASAEAHDFIGHSSEAWRHASVAFGTDPASAAAAAARTTASYTGAEADTADV